jgi:predicted dehydrogenase
MPAFFANTAREQFGLIGVGAVAPRHVTAIRETPGASLLAVCSRNEQLDFAAAIREKRRPLIDGAEGRRSIELIQAVYGSSREGKPIRLG